MGFYPGKIATSRRWRRTFDAASSSVPTRAMIQKNAVIPAVMTPIQYIHGWWWCAASSISSLLKNPANGGTPAIASEALRAWWRPSNLSCSDS